MAYNTPPTFVAGNVLTAAQLNTNIRDNIAWMATDSPCCRVYRDTNQSITTSTATEVLYTQENFDNAGMHSTSSNTDRITIPTGGGGKYLITFAGEWEATVSGGLADVKLNSVADFTSVIAILSTGTDQRFNIMTSYALSAADFIVSEVYQTAGVSKNIQSSSLGGSIAYAPVLAAFWFRT